MTGQPDAAEILAALPLPLASFDEAGRWSGLNEAAQIWLNLSARSVRGLDADDPALLARRAQQRFADRPRTPLAIGLVLLFGALNVLAWTLSWLGVLPQFAAA